MPINPITQSATFPAMANADLLYVVTSTTSSSPQFQFVCDIRYASGSQLLQRIKQQPNPNNVGVFNVGQIIQSYLGVDLAFKAAPFATSSNNAKQFYIAFGEEYGTSTSSSVTLYNGLNSTPNQAPNRRANITARSIFVNGLVEPNSGKFNFDSGSFLTQSATPAGGASFAKQYTLSDAPTSQKIQDGEYHTIALFNGNIVNGTTTNAQDLYYFDVRVYDSASTLVQNFDWFNITSNGGGPRANANQEFPDIYTFTNTGSLLLYAGSGPQNFTDSGNTLNANWRYYTVTWYSQESAGVENLSGSYASVTFTKDEAACDYEGVRFVWKNKYGVWDYYTARLATNSSVQIERNAYDASFVDYSTAGLVPYNISRRGTTQFYNKLDQTKTVTTDYLNQTDADWIEELLYSTDVYVQEGTDFLPVVVTNASVTEKTNPRSQKLYNYEISFKYANQPRPRL